MRSTKIWTYCQVYKLSNVNISLKNVKYTEKIEHQGLEAQQLSQYKAKVFF